MNIRLALLPFWGLLKRELIRDLRRPRPMILLGGVLFVATIVVLASYPSAQVSPTGMRTHASIILSGLSGTLLAAAILLLPGYAATAIVAERESDTFDLLSLSLTRPIVVVLGKLASSLGYFLLIEVAMLPFIATTMFLVGIDTATISFAAIYLGIVALTCASAGIMSSSVARSTPRAVSLAYSSAFIALVGYMVPIGLIIGLIEILEIKQLAPLTRPLLLFFASLSPFGSFGIVVTGVGLPGFMKFGMLLLGQGSFSALSLLVARRMLIRPNTERGFTSYSVPPPLPSSPVGFAPAVYLDERALPPWPPVRDDVNPMLARELLQVRISQRLTPGRFVLILLCLLTIMIVLAFSISESELNVRERNAHVVIHAWSVMMMVLMAFVGPGASASAWSREYERETMDLLRTSLLTPKQLIWGKLLAALRACVFPMVLACIASLPLAVYVFASGQAALHLVLGLISIGVTTLLSVSVAMFMGLLHRRTSACVLYGYTGSMLVLCLPFLINGMIAAATMFSGTRGLRFEPWWLLSPATSYTFILNPDSMMHAASRISIWAVCAVMHTAFALVLVRASVVLLEARHLRDR